MTNDPANKNSHAVALGRLGGKKGGPARAKALSPERRTEIARYAASVRWARHNEYLDALWMLPWLYQQLSSGLDDLDEELIREGIQYYEGIKAQQTM